MNAQMHELETHGPMSVLAAMTRTRLELAGMEFESHLLESISALVTAGAAIVLCLVAFVFIGISMIALFWDTHRVAAAIGTTVAYFTLALVIALYARARWRARPAPFAITLHELELDRGAVRDLAKAIS
jgi:uncharacterized membrane protein YqjE